MGGSARGWRGEGRWRLGWPEWRSEAGSVMPAVVILTTVLLLGLAVLWDWARVQIHWRGLQTASDAAALSAALSGERWSELYIARYRWEVFDPCGCDPNGSPGGEGPPCIPCPEYRRVDFDIPEMRGPDAKLFANSGWGPEGWRTRANCADYDGCSYTIKDRWLQYNPDTASRVARAAFNANARVMGSGAFAWGLDRVSVRDEFGPAAANPPAPGWCSRVMEEDVVEVEAHGTTTFDLLPSLGGPAAQRYSARSTARGTWSGVTTPVHPPDRSETWWGTWSQVCR